MQRREEKSDAKEKDSRRAGDAGTAGDSCAPTAVTSSK